MTKAPPNGVDNATTTREATASVREDGLVSRLERATDGKRPLPSSVESNAAVGQIDDSTRDRSHASFDPGGSRARSMTDGLPSGEPTQRRPS